MRCVVRFEIEIYIKWLETDYVIDLNIFVISWFESRSPIMTSLNSNGQFYLKVRLEFQSKLFVV